MVNIEPKRDGVDGVRLTRLQLIVAAIVLGFMLLPFVVDVMLGKGTFLGFPTDNLLYMAYTLVGGIALTVVLDWFVRRSKRIQEIGSESISKGTSSFLRVFALALVLVLDVGLWMLFFRIVSFGIYAVSTALFFHILWAGFGVFLWRQRSTTFVFAFLLTFLPLILVFLVAVALIA